MATTQDDAFREIQLSGKALVFLAMAVVVIAVSIFLMGVQVGRGVLAQRGLPEAVDQLADAEPPPATAGSGSDAPVTAGEKLSYAERLNAAEPASETLKRPEPVSAEPPTPRPEEVPPAPPDPAPASAAPAAAPAAAPPAVASQEPAGAGFAIQLAALREKSEADAIVTRLAGKGYPAYVVTPQRGAPAVYRVRVGKYADRREADTVAARLQKEEQFKPWVVR